MGVEVGWWDLACPTSGRCDYTGSPRVPPLSPPWLNSVGRGQGRSHRTGEGWPADRTPSLMTHRSPNNKTHTLHVSLIIDYRFKQKLKKISPIIYHKIMPKRLFTFNSHRVIIILYLHSNHVQNWPYNEYFLLHLFLGVGGLGKILQLLLFIIFIITKLNNSYQIPSINSFSWILTAVVRTFSQKY